MEHARRLWLFNFPVDLALFFFVFAMHAARFRSVIRGNFNV